MQFSGKTTVIYSTLIGIITVGVLVLLMSLTNCRQETDLTACSIRWGNYGLLLQVGERVAIWLLGTSDIRLWPARWGIPLALKWSIGMITVSVMGILITLTIAWLERVIKIFGKKTTS